MCPYIHLRTTNTDICDNAYTGLHILNLGTLVQVCS